MMGGFVVRGSAEAIGRQTVVALRRVARVLLFLDAERKESIPYVDVV